MLYRLLLLITLLIPTQLHSAEPKPTILVVGDSLSAAHNIPLESGWVHLLQRKLNTLQQNVSVDRRWQVVNASISGETSSGGLARLPGLLEQHQPELCVLELGANDGLRGQSLKQLRNNLSQMIELCRQHGEVALLGILLPPNYGSRYTQAFQKIYSDLASQYEIPLTPFLLDGVAGEDALMQEDGLHPTEQGQPIVLENAWKALAPALEKAGNS